MTNAHRIWPAQATATEVGHHLVTGYIALSCAAIEAEHLIKIHHLYRGATGWDLQTAILDASTAIENAVCVHDLARYSAFWNHPRTITEADLARATLSDDRRTTSERLVKDLTNAFTALSKAAEHAETLIATDQYYGCSAGYIGGLGWDLETAVDDAVIAIRDAMRVGTLAAINPTFWRPQL